jgi:hypothetical protein
MLDWERKSRLAVSPALLFLEIALNARTGVSAQSP